MSPRVLVIACLSLVIGCGEVAEDRPDGARRDAVTADAPAACEAPVSVAFASPAEGAVVSGVVEVSATSPTPSCVSALELWVDGALVATSEGGPLSWDTATAHENPLAPPGRSFVHGYYFADGRYGDFTGEVDPYTNLYVALPRGYDTSIAWQPELTASLERAVAAERRIFLAMDEESLWPEVLAIAAPAWDRIDFVEVGHETSWTRAETEEWIRRLEAAFAAQGLARKPIGIVWDIDRALITEAVDATGLDWVGIEAYVDPPGASDPAVNVATMIARVTDAMARVPDGKAILIVGQSYDRNGLWPDIATLSALQEPTYTGLAQSDPRVAGIVWFSYARPGGARDHAALRAPHQRIGERVLGTIVPELSNGAHTLELRASTTSSGETAASTITVTVAN